MKKAAQSHKTRFPLFRLYLMSWCVRGGNGGGGGAAGAVAAAVAVGGADAGLPGMPFQNA